MKYFCRISLVLLAAMFFQVNVAGQNAKRELRYWGSPDNYLNAQGLVMLDLVNEALDSCPPSPEPSLIRKQALYNLDAVLHDTKFDGSELVKDFAASRVDRVLKDFEKPMSGKEGIRIYKVYNDGFILRSSKAVVAVDLTGKEGRLIPDSLMTKVVDLCDVLFITHNHDDHCDGNVVEMFASKGKPVYAISNFATQDKRVNLIRYDAPKDLKVKLPGYSLKVKVFPGHQDDLINNVYVFTMPDGITAALLGDQYNREDMAWIKTMKNVVPDLDVLCINCWSNDMADYLSGFSPKVVITGHEDELGHTIDHREAFWLTYYKMSEVYKVTVPYVIMAWGECYAYPGR